MFGPDQEWFEQTPQIMTWPGITMQATFSFSFPTKWDFFTVCEISKGNLMICVHILFIHGQFSNKHDMLCLELGYFITKAFVMKESPEGYFA